MDDYLNYGGWMSLPPLPWLCNQSLIYGFAFPAEAAACQDFLDRSYNRVAGYRQFRVMLDRVGLFAVKAREVRAAAPPFSQEGATAECDIGFWLLVGQYDPAATQPRMIAWVPAYLFVDTALQIAGGREVLGYPKYHAAMRWPEVNPGPGPFAASGLVIEKFGPEARAEARPLLSLTGEDVSPAPVTGSAGDVFRQLCAGADPARLDGLTARLDQPGFIGTMGGLSFPLFHLKQFRAADSPTGACVRQLLQGAQTITRLRRAALLHGAWRLEVGAYDSMPFVRDLGLGTPVDGRLTLTTPVGIFADADFTIGLAHPIA